MFKRLTKARRHSADEIGGGTGILPNPLTLDEPPGGGGRKNSESQLSSYVFATTRSKFSRKSCSDAYSLLQAADEKPDEQLRVSGELADSETDYRVVTAMPAFIVEHEPEKQRGLGVWGLRRVSKKIDSFRRSSSRETISTISERPDNNNVNANNNNNNNNNNNRNLDNANNNRDDKLRLSPSEKKPVSERRFFHSSSRSPSPFKSFFTRMGSTGMLNSSSSSKSSRKLSQNLDDKLNRTSDKENLFRSCSTSQLNTSPTYVKGDDPSEGIDLRINTKNEHGKTVSCDNLSGNQQCEDDVFDESFTSRSSISSSRPFAPCDYTDPNCRGEFMKKSSSCDFKEAKKTNFPYAFLRSRLSVLPEERNYNNTLTTNSVSGKEDRLFKTASEEHFPAMKIEDTFDGTTTLGRRRPSKNGYMTRESQRYMLQDVTSRSARNSYSEYKEDFHRHEQKNLYYGAMNGLEENYRNSISLPYQGSSCGQDRSDIMDLRPDATCSLNLDLSYESSNSTSPMTTGTTATATTTAMTTMTTTTTNSMMTSAMLRNHRRNSAPNGEQRLSSHYVSSNESGYDSDGPRGESAASEAEAMSLKCTDSSDTSSVIDSELEKPMRSSTPSECQEQETKDLNKQLGCSLAYLDEQMESADNIVDGLRWHQSSSGRLLPSIHQSNSSSSPSVSPSSSSTSSKSSAGLQAPVEPLGIQAAAHRVRLQQDKTRFLSDIIQPPKRIRRCRLIQLNRAAPKESLGIRLAQQRAGETRYVVVQLETDGIAHRDGRLRLGDEIVEVEGKDLRTLNSLEEVQEFLRSCEGPKIYLKSAYEETMPEIYLEDTETADDYFERNQSSLSLADTQSTMTSSNSQPKQHIVNSKSQKRPDYLALSQITTTTTLASETTSLSSSSQHPQQQQHQYTTRHVARFEKGLGKPSLGFSVVGGRDSPRGEMGIFVRRVFSGGQADVSKALFQGDEILSLNGKTLKGCTHQEVIELFKAVREGSIELELIRRHRYLKAPLKTAPY